MSVNVIGFVYSGAQALDMSYNLATGKYIVHHQQKLRHYFDFAADQASLNSCYCMGSVPFVVDSLNSVVGHAVARCYVL